MDARLTASQQDHPPLEPIEGNDLSFNDPRSTADIDNRFDFHPATTAEKRGDHTSVREACKRLAHFLDANVPSGREKSLAITNLEQSMMWANAAIARNSD